MEGVFVDTGGWVALFTKNDDHHSRAAAVFEDLKASRVPLFTSDFVIDETITTVLARGGHRQSVAAGDALFSSRLVKIVYVSPSHLASAWDLYKRYADKGFSFTDVTSFAVMKAFGIARAFSFDRHFQRAGFVLIV